MGGAGAWLLACERRFMRRAVSAIGETNRAYMRAGFIGAAADFVQRAAICATLAVRAGRGLLTAGAFTMQLSAVTAFAAGMHRALESVAEIRAYDAYYDALDEYLQIPARLRGGKRLPVPEGAHRIAFERVSFRYPGQEKWALQEVSLVLEPGMRLMLVGENGAGKTTLIKLLTRLYAPTQGRILLDGVDIADLDADAYWALFATVFQDFQLFELPLRDNLTLGRQVPEERLVEALENVGLGPRLRTLPQGLDTYVGREFSEGGFQPSGGERRSWRWQGRCAGRHPSPCWTSRRRRWTRARSRRCLRSSRRWCVAGRRCSSRTGCPARDSATGSRRWMGDGWCRRGRTRS